MLRYGSGVFAPEALSAHSNGFFKAQVCISVQGLCFFVCPHGLQQESGTEEKT
jgi:hypothetical protein